MSGSLLFFAFPAMQCDKSLSIGPLQIVISASDDISYPCLGTAKLFTDFRLRQAAKLNFFNEFFPVHDQLSRLRFCKSSAFAILFSRTIGL